MFPNTPYECEVCGYASNEKFQLKEHKKSWGKIHEELKHTNHKEK